MTPLPPTLKVLHWLMALLIFFMLIEGYFKWHRAVGLIILFLLAVRISVRVLRIRDKQNLSTLPDWAAYSVHMLLYFLMFAIPITGLLRSFYAGAKINFFGFFTMSSLLIPDKKLSSIFSNMHAILTNVLWAVIAMHVLAAFYHFFILKDHTLRRIFW